MIKAGITGGIGSGKTIVCQVFKLLKVPVYHADIEAKKLYESHPEIRNKMIELFGKDIYTGSKMNRRRLSDLIFQNNELLMKVNKIVHPEVASHFINWCSNHSCEKYVIQESAILFESNAYRMMDICITVTAPADERIQRIMKRRDMTEARAKDIMKIQMHDDLKVKQSHFVIENDCRQLILPQILKIHNEILKTTKDHEGV